MNTTDEESETPAQKHASFLRSVLALDHTDPNLPRFVPPSDAEPGTAPVPDAPRDMKTHTERLRSRLHPRRLR